MKTGKKVLGRVVVVLGLWVALTVLFVGTLLCVYLIDNSALRGNIEASRGELLAVDRTMEEQGHWYDFYRPDTFTDNLMLSLSYEPEPADGDSLVYRALYSEVRSRAEMPEWGKELRFPMAEPAHPDEYIYTYPRYWHGYQVVVRPLLVIVDYDGIRLINIVLCALLGTCMLVLIRRRISLSVAVWIGAVVLLFMGVWVVPGCMQFATCFILMFCAGIAVLTNKKLTAGLFPLFCTFFAVGAVTVYFDFLTTPLLTLGVPLALLLSAYPARENPVGRTMTAWVGWGAGYGLLWFTKWVIAGIVSGADTLGDALRQVVLRVDSHVGTPAMDAALPLIVTLLFIGICALGVYAYATYRRDDALKPYIGLLLTAALPLLWAILIRNHTFYHHWFTWRQGLVSVICLGLYLQQYLKVKRNNLHSHE